MNSRKSWIATAAIFLAVTGFSRGWAQDNGSGPAAPESTPTLETTPVVPNKPLNTREKLQDLEDENQNLEQRLQALENKVDAVAAATPAATPAGMNGNEGPEANANPENGMVDHSTLFRNGTEYLDIASEARHLIFSDADGRSQFRVGGYQFADFRDYWQPNSEYLLNDYIKQEAPVSASEQKDFNGFVARKSHLDFGGRFDNMFGMSIGIESDKSTALQFGVFHAYVYVKLDKALVITAGKFANILSLEGLQPSDNLPFMEASMLVNLVPNKDIGILASGEFGHFMDYGLELSNGQQDNESSATDPGLAGQNAKAFTGRLFFTPWEKSGDEWLEGLGFGVAGAYQNQTGALASGSSVLAENIPWYNGLSTSLGGNEFAFDGGLNGALADGDFYHLDGQFYYYQGPFGLQGEWVQSTQTVAEPNQPSVAISNSAWLLEATWVIGGEAGFEGPHVDEPFDLSNGKLGAFEIVARVDQLSADPKAFAVGFNYDPAGGSLATGAQLATAYGIGVNWWFNENFKTMLDFERTDFAGGNVPVNPEQVLFARAALIL